MSRLYRILDKLADRAAASPYAVVTTSIAITVPANSYASESTTITVPTGYVACAVAGWSSRASGAIPVAVTVTPTANVVAAACRNVTSSSINQTITVTVLCLQAPTS